MMLPAVVSSVRAAQQSGLDQGVATFEGDGLHSASGSWTRASRSAEKTRDAASQISGLVRLGDAYAAVGRYRQVVIVLDAAQGVLGRNRIPARLTNCRSFTLKSNILCIS